ncbi:hypothetical protein D0Q02_07030 [Micromonospora craniellae]|uniref:GP-PDE domain-containing protein n=1 Tax=Micromonospora craniellae TaxID=2294034 RepID=A0A372G2T4_9ACTN|nr:hypothetical protein D0Q02_07030 [Micromonospora craniellae]
MAHTPIAHRGLVATDRPANSLAAFEAAASACELDVQLTAAGELVVVHDYDLTGVAVHALPGSPADVGLVPAALRGVLPGDRLAVSIGDHGGEVLDRTLWTVVPAAAHDDVLVAGVRVVVLWAHQHTGFGQPHQPVSPMDALRGDHVG